MPGYLFAVDGGASKTDAELVAADGTTLAQVRAGPCNLYRDAASGLLAIRSAWDACCRRAGLDPEGTATSTTISAGLAGTSAAAGRDYFLRNTEQFGGRRLSSDAYAALVGAFRGGPGALLNVGTGAAACRLRVSGGTVERRGGWGFPAGDGGSGAWLGLQVMTAWLEHRDGLGSGGDALWAEAEAIAGSDREAILCWLHRATPADYARLAPAVVRAAEGGCTHAAALLAQATGHLVRLISSLSDGLPVAVTGGLAPAFGPRIAAALGRPVAIGTDFGLRGAKLIGAGGVRAEFGAL